MSSVCRKPLINTNAAVQQSPSRRLSSNSAGCPAIKEKQYRTRFLIYRADRFWSFAGQRYSLFYSENKMTFAVTRNNQEHVLDLSLNKLSEQLDPDRFFRANRQIILCIDAIDHAEPYFNGKNIGNGTSAV